jgi:hypothetical protein
MGNLLQSVTLLSHEECVYGNLLSREEWVDVKLVNECHPSVT